MGFRSAISSFFKELTAAKAETGITSPAPASSSLLAMMSQNPTLGDVPQRWIQSLMGPGLPMAPWGAGMRGELAEVEPRSFQYVPNVNATIAPRLAYGLMQFAQLKYYAENVPEVARARRLLIEELKNYTPEILGPDGNIVQKARVEVHKDDLGRPLRDEFGHVVKTFTGDNEIEQYPELGWMTTCPQPTITGHTILSPNKYSNPKGGDTYKAVVPDLESMQALGKTRDALDHLIVKEEDVVVAVPEIAWHVTRPDRRNAWPMWLTRFLYNVLVYDAGCFYRIRDEAGQIIGMRVIDGSTIFCLIDERGEQPAPPAPAFTQIIFGQPRQWFNTLQLWYAPRQLRVDAPYGITPVEDSGYAIPYLDNLWQYETAYYTEGSSPEMLVEAPPGWTPDQVIAYEKEFNSRMSGNNAERRRMRFVPPGTKPMEVKTHVWPKESYQVASEIVDINMGIHPSELGQVPGKGAGLGGKGYQEKGEDSHARMGPAPVRQYIEAAFNDVLAEMGYKGFTYRLGVVDTGIDTDAEEKKWLDRWMNGAIPRDDYLEGVGLDPVGGPTGAAYLMPKGKSDSEDGVDENVRAATNTASGQDDPESEEVSDKTPDAHDEDANVVQEKRFPDTVHNVDDFEAVWKVADVRKHCGVCPEDDDYYGSPVAHDRTVMFPIQGANETEVVAMTPRGLEARPALWKPAGGEDDSLVEAIGGPLFPREEAAYLLDRSMGLYLVPVAYVAEVDDEVGAVLHYVRGVEPREDIWSYEYSWVMKSAMLDYVMGQTDRNDHNWLTHPDDPKRPILIDNGMTFPTTVKPVGSMFVEACRGRNLSEIPGLLQTVRRNLGDVVWRDIAQLVGEEAAALAKERMCEVAEGELIPPSG